MPMVLFLPPAIARKQTYPGTISQIAFSARFFQRLDILRAQKKSLIMQGALDDNVLPAVQERFAQTYRDAGGDIQYQLFEGCEHEWVAQPGPQTDHAREMVKAFIARQVNAS